MRNNDRNQTARKPAPSAADNCLHINQLSVLRGMVLVISNLSHQQSAGDICRLTGPNGAGKSTLLRTIAGRLPATGGEINCAVPIIYVGHTDGLSGAISGRENLASWAKINGISATENTIDSALSSFATNRLPICQCGFYRAASAAGWHLPDWRWLRQTPFGFWTNPMLALIRHQAAFLTKLCKNMQRLVAWRWQQRILILPQRQSRDHCICPGW